MVRFAQQIMAKFASVTRELEVTLGPDTGDLSLRTGKQVNSLLELNLCNSHE